MHIMVWSGGANLREGNPVRSSSCCATFSHFIMPQNTYHHATPDVGDIAKAARSIASKVPKLARGMYDSLFLTMEEGSQKGQQSAAW